MNIPSSYDNDKDNNNNNNHSKKETPKDTDSLIPKNIKKEKKREENRNEEDDNDNEINNRPSLTRVSYLEVPTIVIPKDNENSKNKRNIPWKAIFTHKCVYAMYFYDDLLFN